mmetsp:Transcript_8542/g.25569  ORF Transcript_8542/g.25569 Transcript_8542/m.25569 type:complete len:227 (+) Transcript_8542:569-1249(+)
MRIGAKNSGSRRLRKRCRLQPLSNWNCVGDLCHRVSSRLKGVRGDSGSPMSWKRTQRLQPWHQIRKMPGESLLPDLSCLLQLDAASLAWVAWWPASATYRGRGRTVSLPPNAVGSQFGGLRFPGSTSLQMPCRIMLSVRPHSCGGLAGKAAIVGSIAGSATVSASTTGVGLWVAIEEADAGVVRSSPIAAGTTVGLKAADLKRGPIGSGLTHAFATCQCHTILRKL